MYTPLCWIRNLEALNATHIFADLVIAFTLCVVIGYTFSYAAVNDYGPGLQMINPDTFLNIVGFSVFAYEGIGVILPVMEIT